MKNTEKIEAIKNGKPVRAADFVFFGILAAAILIGCYFVYWAPAPSLGGAVAVVQQDGVKTGEFPLAENAEYIIGGGALTLVIEDGACYVKNPDCPDKICERTRINRVNQRIVCVPQKIVIRIAGESEIHFYT